MSLGEKFRHWRRRRQRAARKQGEALLREFVYLDEVSVFSLISSGLGSVATEFTATESNSLAAELTGTAGASAGVLKSEIKSRMEATQTQGTQVLRKATVQATFKELYEYVEGGFVLRPATKAPPDVRDAQDLGTALERARKGRWAMPASELARGQLTEIEVELDAEDIFRVGAVVGTFLELSQEVPELLGPDVREQLREALSVNAVLNKLLVGLVPVRGRAIDYVTVEAADQEWVVHRMVLQQLPEGWAPQASALDVVALAEASLFWKDIRRVLFSTSRYSVLCRIGRDGLHNDWTPVKLVDVVRGFAPEVAEQFGAVGQDLVAAMNRGTASQGDDSHTKMREALQAYGRALAAQYDKEWDPTLVAGDVIPVDRTRTWTTVEEQRPPFEALTHRLLETYGIDPDRELMATLRHQALVQAGLVPSAGSAVSQNNAAPAPRPVEPQSRILDTELIAIYW